MIILTQNFMVSKVLIRGRIMEHQQQECIGLVLPDKHRNTIALSSTQMEMPNLVCKNLLFEDIPIFFY